MRARLFRPADMLLERVSVLLKRAEQALARIAEHHQTCGPCVVRADCADGRELRRAWSRAIEVWEATLRLRQGITTWPRGYERTYRAHAPAERTREHDEANEKSLQKLDQQARKWRVYKRHRNR